MLQQRVETLSEILGSRIQGEISSRADLFSSSFSKEEQSFESYRLAISDGIVFPHVIVPRSGDAEDLFATIATYYPELSPLTAFVHILSAETSSLMYLRSSSEGNISLYKQARSRRASIGAALGEAILTGFGAFEDIGALPSYSAVRRTLAFTLGRSQELYGNKFPANRLSERWILFRDITGLSYSRSVVNAVLRVHELDNDRAKVKSERPGIEGSLHAAMKAFLVGDDPNGDYLETIIANLYPDGILFLRELSGVFDGRMRAFVKLVELIQKNSRGIEIDEIAIGYACNRILPSSFLHIGALISLIQFFPAALIWYGFFSTLSKPSKTTSLNPGLLMKLERDLVEPFSFEHRPRCDISLEELQVISRAKMRADVVKPTQQRALLVGLLPGVDVYSRFGSETDQSAERIKRDTEISMVNERITSLLEEALQVIKQSSVSPSTTLSQTTPVRRAKKRLR